MPRKPRFFVPDIPVHVVQRGHDRHAVFGDAGDYREYLTWLEQGAKKYSVAIHAYVLMTNHVHILATPIDATGVSQMMQYIGRRYVQYFNHKYGHSGSLWEGRFKASLVSSERYLLACMRYIELNPVRASMVGRPSAYLWSSYLVNVGLEASAWVSPHDVYKRLALSDNLRYQAYADLFIGQFEPELASDIHAAWQTGTPLGDNQFKEQIEQLLGQKVGQARRGRPRKKAEDSS